MRRLQAHWCALHGVLSHAEDEQSCVDGLSFVNVITSVGLSVNPRIIPMAFDNKQVCFCLI